MVLPILLTMFMGVFDFGWVLHQQIALDNATREGARRGAIGTNDAGIRTAMQSVCSFTLNPAWITITVVDDTGATQAANSRQPDDILIVTVNRPNIALITPIRSFVDTIGTINLESEARFIIE
jgi:Flp pilus assembly protein TadG